MDERKLAIIIAAAARAQIRAMGLLADALVPYESRRHAYPEPQDFVRIIEEEGIDYNSVIGLVNG